MAIQQTSSFSGHHGHSGSMPEPGSAGHHALKDQLQQRLQAQIPVAPPVSAPPTAPGGSLPLPVLVTPNTPQSGSIDRPDYGLEPYNPPPIPTPTYKLPAESSTQGPAQTPLQGVIEQPLAKIDAPIDIQAWNTALGKVSHTLRLGLLSPAAQLLINQQADKNLGLNTEYALGLQTPADGQNLALVGSLKEIIAFLSVKDNAERFVHMLNPNASVTLKGLTQRYDQALNTQADQIALNQARTFLKNLQTATTPGNPSFKQLYPNLSISTLTDRSARLKHGIQVNQNSDKADKSLNQTYIFEFDYPVQLTDGKTRSVAVNLAGPLESLGPFIARGGYSWLTANGLTGNQRTGLTTEGLVKRYETAKASTFDPNQRSADQTGSTVDTQLVKPVEQLTLDDEESTIPKTLPFGSDKSPFISVKPTDPDQQNNTGVIGLQPKDAIQPPKPGSTDNINNSSDPIKASASDDTTQNNNAENTETDNQPDDWVDVLIQDADAGLQAFIQAHPKTQHAVIGHAHSVDEVRPKQVLTSIARGQKAVAAIQQIRQNQTPEGLPAALAGNPALPETPLADMQAILKELLHGTSIKVQEVVTLATQHWNMHPYELAWDIRMQNVLYEADKIANKSEDRTSKTSQYIQTAANQLGRAILGYAKTVGSDQVDTRDLTTAMYFNGENISVSGVPLDDIVINGTPLTKESLIHLFGLPDNSNVIIRHINKKQISYLQNNLADAVINYGYQLAVKTPFNDGHIHYFLFKYSLGEWNIAAAALRTKSNAPSGYAGRMVAHLYEGADAHQISEIILEAGRGELKKISKIGLYLGGYNENKNSTGYYTWPVYWGANAQLHLDTVINMPESIETAWHNFLDKQVEQKKLTAEQAAELHPLDSLVKLTATPEGRNYWREHGDTIKVSVNFNPDDPSTILLKQRAEDTMKRLSIRIYPLYGQQTTDNNNPDTQSTIQRTIIGPDGEIPVNIATDYTPKPTENTLDIDALNPEAFNAITKTEEYRDASPIERYRMGIEALGGTLTWLNAIRVQQLITGDDRANINEMLLNIGSWIGAKQPSLENILVKIFHDIHPVMGLPNDTADANHAYPRYSITATPDINDIQKFHAASIQELKTNLENMSAFTADYFRFSIGSLAAGESSIKEMLNNTASKLGLLHNNQDKELFMLAITQAGTKPQNAEQIIKTLFRRNYQNTSAETLRNQYAATLAIMHLTGADKIRDQVITQINPTGEKKYRLSQEDTPAVQTLLNWAANTRLPSADEFERYYNQIRDLLSTTIFELAAKEWNIIYQYKRGEISLEDALDILNAK